MKIVWSHRAKLRRGEIFDFIAKDNPTAAMEMDNKFEKAVKSLLVFPDSGRPGLVNGTRELVIRSTYIVVYRKRGDKVQIVTIRHGAQLYLSIHRRLFG